MFQDLTRRLEGAMRKLAGWGANSSHEFHPRWGAVGAAGSPPSRIPGDSPSFSSMLSTQSAERSRYHSRWVASRM